MNHSFFHNWSGFFAAARRLTLDVGFNPREAKVQPTSRQRRLNSTVATRRMRFDVRLRGLKPTSKLKPSLSRRRGWLGILSFGCMLIVVLVNLM